MIIPEDLSNLVELLAFTARFEERLELDRDIEVILNRVLAAPGDEDDVDSRPEATASSTPYWIIGLSTSGEHFV